MNTLSTTDVIAVLESFLQMSNRYLSDGRIIDMGQLGSFTPSILSCVEDNAAAVDQINIKRLKINFRPSGLLREKLATVKFKKTSSAQQEETETIP